MELPEATRSRIDHLVAACRTPREALLQTLEIIQQARGHVSDEAAGYVANRLKINRADVDDVLSFYPAFSRAPLGTHVIRVCRTLPCALVGGEALLDHLSRKLGVAPGETTPDGRFTLLAVECLGLCDQAPAMMIGDGVFGRLTPGRIDEALASLED